MGVWCHFQQYFRLTMAVRGRISTINRKPQLNKTDALKYNKFHGSPFKGNFNQVVIDQSTVN